jgi:hypothetical protein
MDGDGPEPFLKTLWTLIKLGAVLYCASWVFLACSGQLPSDPG